LSVVCRTDIAHRHGVEVAFVHCISPDFALRYQGAFPALSKMLDEVIIRERERGIGVNTPLPILRSWIDANFCLCARQHSLIEHATNRPGLSGRPRTHRQSP